MNFNLEALKVVEKSNSRESRSKGEVSSNFQFRLLRAVRRKDGVEEVRSIFYLSNEQFQTLGLEDKGLIQIKAPNADGTIGVAFAVVAEENATLFKGRLNSDGTKGVKSKMVNSNILEKDLISAGIIEAETMGNQFMALTKIEGSEGYELKAGLIAVGGIYVITKGEGSVKEFPSKKEESNAIAPTPVAETAVVDSADFDDDI